MILKILVRALETRILYSIKLSVEIIFLVSQLVQAALKMLSFAAGNDVRKANFRIMSYEKTICRDL